MTTMTHEAGRSVRPRLDELETRINRHAIAPGRLPILDLGRRSEDDATAGSDRAVALTALAVAVLVAIAAVVGLG